MFLSQTISTTLILSLNLAAALATFIYICRIIVVSVSDRFPISRFPGSIDRSALHRYVGDLKRSLDNQRVRRRRILLSRKQVVQLCRELKTLVMSGIQIVNLPAIHLVSIRRHQQVQA